MKRNSSLSESLDFVETADVCGVQREICVGDERPPQFACTSQNIAAATALLHRFLEPTTPEEQLACCDMRTLLERVVAQQAESLMSPQRGPTLANVLPPSCTMRTHLSTRLQAAARDTSRSRCATA